MNKITEVKIERGIPTLYVDGQPFWAFAGEVHNSAAYAPGQDGGREVTVEEVAAPANSFNYELVCNISRRVPRTYIRDGRELGQVNYLLD